MHHGIFSCEPETPLGEVAAIMSARRVHALAIPERAGRPPAIVCDLDVVAAAAFSDRFTAGDMAATEPLTVTSDSTLRQAAQLMAQHEVTHLIVSDAVDGHPTGILSSTDLLSVFALGEESRT
jgi:CBS domain-containing protein